MLKNAAETAIGNAPVPVSAVSVDDWRDSYRRRTVLTDVLCISWAVAGAHLVSFGSDAARVAISGRPQLVLSYTLISVLLSVLWLLVLQFVGSRDPRVIGTEFTEYRRVIAASLGLFGAVAIVAYLLKTEIARGYLITALPLGLGALLLTRWMWRQWLRERRSRGTYSYRVLLVGSLSNVLHLGNELIRNPAAGYHVVGAVIPGVDRPLRIRGQSVQVSPHISGILAEVDRVGADTVAVAGTDDLPPEKLRELSWGLEPGRRHLVVSPGLTDIAGPRLHTRPVSGLPLIHIETPRYEGRKLYAKRTFDIVFSGGLILLLLPILVTVAVLVKLPDGGPVFFRQKRVGLNGETFDMLKFRSMVVGAESRLEALRAQQDGAGNAVLFKMKDDPRITRVGKVLRRYSVDELPQLFNVLLGSMSLVGPRPPLLSEVEKYEWRVHRRFLVKPGVTGLWQVSGRSDLSWEDSVRLDLYYVENWSITSDIVILARTVRAVLASQGAY